MPITQPAPRRTPTQGMLSVEKNSVDDTDGASEADDEVTDIRDMPPTDAEAVAEAAEAEPVVGLAQDAGLLTEEQYRGLFSWAKKAVTKTVSTLKDAALSNAKDLLKAGLPIAGTAVGGFFGGPAGAALGGKAGGFAGSFVREVAETADAQQARAIRELESYEVEVAQLSAVIDQVLEEALPVVIDEMSRDFAERGARGEGGPADDEVMERFWGKAFGKIASAIADELPWAIKKATQYLGEGGSRDTGTIDPLMIDSEIARRFWGPAFSAVISSIQSALPGLFEQIAGGTRAAPWDSDSITWRDLEETRRLRRGDNIAVTRQSAIEDSTTVELALELPPHKSWWKGLQVRGSDDSLLAAVDVEGELKAGSVRVHVETLRAGASLIFTKADGVYRLPASELPQLGGKRVEFYWYAG